MQDRLVWLAELMATDDCPRAMYYQDKRLK